MTDTTTKTTRRRGPIGRLDVETIVAAGMRIAGAPDAKSLTVRELGAALKADPSAIYRHVGSKDGLVRLLLDRLTGMIRERTADASGWRDFLVRNALATIELSLAYPVIGAQAMQLSSRGDHELRLVEEILGAFHDAGLDDERAVRFYGMYSVFVLSYSTSAAANRLSPEADDATPLWIERSLDVDPDAFPRITASRAGLDELTDFAAFRDGLELILDSVESAR